MSPSSTDAMKTNRGAAGAHLKNAAADAGSAVRNAAQVAGEELKVGGSAVKADLADSALAGIAALEEGGGVAREQVDALLDKGRDLIDSAADLIRERPIASFGVAFAAGWIIAKLARSGGDTQARDVAGHAPDGGRPGRVVDPHTPTQPRAPPGTPRPSHAPQSPRPAPSFPASPVHGTARLRHRLPELHAERVR